MTAVYIIQGIRKTKACILLVLICSLILIFCKKFFSCYWKKNGKHIFFRNKRAIGCSALGGIGNNYTVLFVIIA
jgi:hypothetical protein